MKLIGTTGLELIQSHTIDFLRCYRKPELIKTLRSTTSPNADYQRLLTICGISAELFYFCLTGFDYQDSAEANGLSNRPGLYYVRITSNDRSFYGHSFCVRVGESAVYLYDSYIGKRVLLEWDITDSYEQLRQAVDRFVIAPNKNDWFTITDESEYKDKPRRSLKEPVDIRIFYTPRYNLKDIETNLKELKDRSVELREYYKILTKLE